MKKKLLIAIATGIFMIAMMVNFSVTQMNKSGKLSIENISLMTQAVAEYNGITCPGGACKSTHGDCEACCALGQRAYCNYFECECKQG